MSFQCPEVYNIHYIDMSGIITYSTVIAPLNGETIIGKSIKEILTPGDAKPLFNALFKTAMGLNYQWYKYAIMDDVFLALIEHLPVQEMFSIHEARMDDGQETKKYKNFLYAASGCFYRNYKIAEPFKLF